MTPPVPPRPRIDVGGALTWALRSFRHNAVVLVAAAAVVAVLTVPQQLATRPFEDLAVCTQTSVAGELAACVADLAPTLMAPVAVAAIFAVVSLVAQYGVQRGALIVTDGRSPTVPDSFAPRRLGTYALFVVIMALLAAIGLFLCVLPGLLVLLFLQLGPYAILDRGCGVIEAARLSITSIGANLGPAIAMGAFNALAFLVGGLLYGIVGLVTLPVAALFTAYLYRQFTGGSVAEPGR
jgi:uncharacterized membrane protein